MMPKYLESDDPFRTLAELKNAADARILPWQNALKKGDRFFYYSAEAEVVIWGEVLEDQTDPEMFGYRFCRCYSPIVPTGEMGDVHVSVIHRVVSSDVFEMARATGWPHDEETFTRFAARIHPTSRPPSKDMN